MTPIEMAQQIVREPSRGTNPSDATVLARALIESEARLAAAQAALMKIDDYNRGAIERATERQLKAQDAYKATRKDPASTEFQLKDTHRYLQEANGVLHGIINATLNTRTTIQFAERIGKAALDAALAKAREEMRDAAVKALHAEGDEARTALAALDERDAIPTRGFSGKPVVRQSGAAVQMKRVVAEIDERVARIAALPTTGGKP